MRRGWIGIAAGAAAVFFAGGARAASSDPNLKWHSAQTQHFVVYWYDGEELAAQQYLSHILEPVYDKVTKAVDWRPPGKTHVILEDVTDGANGFATTIPYDAIHLYVTAPTEGSSLDYYDEWLSLLVTHEFTHICHLSKLGGMPTLLHPVFGSVISPNQILPRWIIEGYATYQETQLTQAGRGRSAFSEMILRSAVLEKNWPPLDRLGGDTESWPGGYLPYIFGVEFLQYCRDTYGDDKVTRFTHLTASDPFPFFPFWPLLEVDAHRAFGKSFYKLWRDFHASLEKKYGDEETRLEAQGITPVEQLTHYGSGTAGPRVSPDGKSIVFSASNGKGPAAIHVMDVDGKHDKVLLSKYYSDSFGWSPDSKTIAFGTTKLWDEFYLFDDVYTYSLDGKVMNRKTRGARARNPDFRPDGTELLFVTNDVSNNDLTSMKIDESLTWKTDNRDFTEYSTPRWRPDGKALAVSTWQTAGFRDIVLLQPDGKLIQRITADRFLDRDPSWSPDGKYLLFSSDRTGIPNLYAWESATGNYFQVTNVLGGAFQPSVATTGSSGWIVFQGYTSKGYDVFRTAYDPTKWKQIGWTFDPEIYDATCKPKSASLDDGGEPCGDGALPRDPKESAFAFIQQNSVPHALRGYGLGPGAGMSESSWPFTPHPEAGGDDEPGPDVRTANDKIAGGGNRPKNRPDKNAGVDLSPFKPRGYHPWKTLLPRYILPAQLYITESGAYFGASTGGTDPIFRHSWSAWADYNTSAGFLGGGFRWFYDRFKPTLYVGGDEYVLDYGQSIYEYPDLTQPGSHILNIHGNYRHYFEQHQSAQVGAFYLWRQRYFFSGQFLYDHRNAWSKLDAFTYEPFLPVRGNFSGPSLAITWDKTNAWRYSISPEQGYALTVTGTAWEKMFASDFRKEIVTADGRYYIPVPLIPFSVIALRGVGGFAQGDAIRPSTFRVGGALGESVFTFTTPNYYSLRGFPFFAFGGERLVLGSAEYRFPIDRPNRGLGTGPVYLQHVHGSIFADSGQVWNDGPISTAQTAWHTGVGAEVRFDTIWYYYFPLTIRLGYAFALNNDPAGYKAGDPYGLIFTLGTSF